MLVLSALFPKIINSGSYVESLTNLMKKLTYQKLPPERYSKKSFTSIREHLWSYKLSPYESDQEFKIPKSAGFDKLEEIEKHTAILCYAQLPGLSTRLSKDSMLNYIFPYKQSSFVKLTVSNPLDYSLKSKSLLVVFSSPPIQAIVKFKWHAFARQCWIIFFFFYLLTLVLLSVAVYCKNNKTINDDTLNKMWITNMIFGAILALVVLRCGIALSIMKFKEINNRERNIRYLLSPISYFIIVTFILPFIVSFLEYKQYLDIENHLNSDSIVKVKACFIAFTFLMSWICLIALLIAVRNIGIFIISFIEICHRIAWFLIFLFLVLLACAHAAMTYLTLVPKETTENNGNNANYATSHFDSFGKSLRSFWTMMLSDYDPVKDERTSAFTIKFIFLFVVNILLLNVLSMYCI
ncbi:hypothetical protein C1646_708476 [Rhizophagus diaphanus]|nr:hypothetical protein C1646_708476 [Rhizophagus diaphanus] [Rhizophagus sp. MUCL 43196]